jgi:ABC-2 type transport system ATP-binding protein
MTTIQYEIATHGLSKTYKLNKSKSVQAVRKIDLFVKKGIHGFLGPNGAGKTTTINMLIGSLPITEGSAKIRDFSAGSAEANSLFGFLPQDPQFYQNMTGLQYLIYMARLSGMRKKDATDRARQMIIEFELDDAQDRKLKTYSGGMKQRIGLAAALIHNPEILILDEPTANLDPGGRKAMIDKIKSLSSEKNITVFVSSHILSEIEQMCDTVTIIHEGNIIASDTIKNIKEQFLGTTFILNTNINDQVKKCLENHPIIEKIWEGTYNEEQILFIIPKDPSLLKKEIPQLIIDLDAELLFFKQPDISLQDIFMQLTQNGGNEV